ncbi:MAG TPA: hypothetical protein VHS58_08490 [Acetobacteraceae bacterium]|nr:hypothetical protein [Acetobacteraceae bacterium]
MTEILAGPGRPQVSAWRLAGRLACTGVVAAALAIVMVTTLAGEMKDDIAWLLYVAQQWLHGSRLYVDVVEVNPPLIVWICALPAWLAELTGTRLQVAAMLFFCAIIMACLGWAVAILTRARKPLGDPFVLFAIGAPVLLLIPGVEFGQREHLLIAAALPYLAVVARELADDTPGDATAIAAGVVAALGCALKPRYVLPFGMLEAYAIWQGLRWFRLSTLAAGGTLAVYFAAILIFEPAYFGNAIPMAVALYGASDVPFLDLLFDCRLLLFGIAVGCVLVATQPVRGERFRLPGVLLVFAIGAMLECFIQGKNWFYHQIPATIAAVLCLIAWTAMRLRADWRPGWRRLGPGALAVLALLAFGLGAYERIDPQMRIALARRVTVEERLAALIRREHAKSYLALSDWIGLGFPVVNETGVVWASRFDSMWALDGEMWRAARDGRAPADWPVRRWVAADFKRACPDLVVVDRRNPIDYVELIGRADGEFLKLWRHYQRIASFDGLVVFRRNRLAAGPGFECNGTTTVRNKPVVPSGALASYPNRRG